MKILFITPSYFPAIKYGGPIESIHNLCKALVQKGFLVSVLTTNAGIEKDIELNKWHDIDGVKVKYLKYYFYEHFTFSPRLFLEACKIVKDFDVVYIFPVWNFTVLAGALSCIINKKPFIVSPRGTLYRETIELKSKLIKQFYLNSFKWIILDKASAIHFTSEDEKVKVFEYLKLKNKCFVIPNGIDLDTFKQAENKELFIKKYPLLNEKEYILFLGRISKKKGLDILIPAFSKLSGEVKDLYLVIAGTDNDGYKKELDKLIEKEGIKDKVLFTGLLSGGDKFSAYRNAEMFVLSSYSENFGMSVVEAMACDTPVVVSDKVALSKDIIKYNAGIVTEIDPESLYLGMKRMLDNDKRIYVKNARNLLNETFSIDKVTEDIIERFKELRHE